MNIGDLVEYQTGLGEYGQGTVTKINDHFERVTIKDSEDGSLWCGPMDLCSVVAPWSNDMDRGSQDSEFDNGGQ